MTHPNAAHARRLNNGVQTKAACNGKSRNLEEREQRRVATTKASDSRRRRGPCVHLLALLLIGAVLGRARSAQSGPMMHRGCQITQPRPH